MRRRPEAGEGHTRTFKQNKERGCEEDQGRAPPVVAFPHKFLHLTFALDCDFHGDLTTSLLTPALGNL